MVLVTAFGSLSPCISRFCHKMTRIANVPPFRCLHLDPKHISRYLWQRTTHWMSKTSRYLDIFDILISSISFVIFGKELLIGCQRPREPRPPPATRRISGPLKRTLLMMMMKTGCTQIPISTLSHIWVFVRLYGIVFVIIVIIIIIIMIIKSEGVNAQL